MLLYIYVTLTVFIVPDILINLMSPFNYNSMRHTKTILKK